MFFVPHSECNFKQVLDCVKIAFHHKNIPEIIEKISLFIRSNEEEETTFSMFLKTNYPDENDRVKIFFHGKNENLTIMRSLFDIVKRWENRRPLILSQERATEFNMELMIWTKEYADKILNKLVGLKSS